jgi:hypothetical protein
MKIIATVSAIVLLGVLWQFGQHQQQEIDELKKALSDRSTQNAVAQQTACADAAHEFMARHGERAEAGFAVSYTNHYNTRLKKCFILVSMWLSAVDAQTLEVYDAIEARRYAMYNGHNLCEAPPLGITRACRYDTGEFWFDGNDERRPDVIIGATPPIWGGGGSGDDHTQQQFRDRIRPFMTE